MAAVGDWFIDMNGGLPGHLWQNITTLTPGESYVFSAFVSGNYNNGCACNNQPRLTEVSIDGALIGTVGTNFAPAGWSTGSPQWVRQTLSFTAPVGKSWFILRLQSISTAQVNAGSFLDDLHLGPPPTPTQTPTTSSSPSVSASTSASGSVSRSASASSSGTPSVSRSSSASGSASKTVSPSISASSSGSSTVSPTRSAPWAVANGMSAFNLLVNGGFEVNEPLLGGGGYNPAFGWTWTCSSNGGPCIDLLGPTTDPQEGNSHVDMSGSTAGDLSQNVTGVIPGQSYVVSAWASGNYDCGTGCQQETRYTTVSIDGVSIGQFGVASMTPGHSWYDVAWERQTLSFTAPAGKTWLVLKLQSISGRGNAGTLLDGVYLGFPPSPTQTPSPSTSGSPSSSVSPGVSASVSGSASLTFSQTPSVSASFSRTPSVAASGSGSPSVTRSSDPSPSVTRSVAPSPSVTRSVDPSLSVSPSFTSTPVTASTTPTFSATATASVSAFVKQAKVLQFLTFSFPVGVAGAGLCTGNSGASGLAVKLLTPEEGVSAALRRDFAIVARALERDVQLRTLIVCNTTVLTLGPDHPVNTQPLGLDPALSAVAEELGLTFDAALAADLTGGRLALADGRAPSAMQSLRKLQQGAPTCSAFDTTLQPVGTLDIKVLVATPSRRRLRPSTASILHWRRYPTPRPLSVQAPGRRSLRAWPTALRLMSLLRAAVTAGRALRMRTSTAASSAPLQATSRFPGAPTLPAASSATPRATVGHRRLLSLPSLSRQHPSALRL